MIVFASVIQKISINKHASTLESKNAMLNWKEVEWNTNKKENINKAKFGPLKGPQNW